MYIHCLLKKINEGIIKDTTNKGLIGNLSSLVWKESGKPFYYLIGGMQFTIDEIKHGVLRGNKKCPGSFMRVLGGND
jgi:hypothetical protein